VSGSAGLQLLLYGKQGVNIKFTRLIILLSIWLQFVLPAYGQHEDKAAPSSLPWQLIGEKAGENTVFSQGQSMLRFLKG
jgi:hypothetical protein